VFLDEENEERVKDIIETFKLKNKVTNISEISIMFPDKAIETGGILSTITKELIVNDIIVSEMLTASPELLIYVKEEYVLKTYEILKRLQK